MTPPGQRTEIGYAARGGIATFAGAAASAGLGFAFNLLLARGLGSTGAGVVLQAIAVFSIVMSLARLGLDTTAVWLLPRVVAGDRRSVRPALVGLLLPAVGLSVLVMVGWWLVGRGFVGGALRSDVLSAVDATMWMLPAAVLMTVALASTRAFGGVVPFNLIGNVAVPLLRPVAVVIITAVGGGALAVTWGWSSAWLVGALAAVAVLARQARRTTAGMTEGWWPDRALMRRIGAYALPRAVASGLEQSILWLDVVLVGVILGSAPAGVYGSAARFVGAGVIVATALRIVVAPRFSALLAQRRNHDVQHLYAVTARWILLFGAPIYLILAVYADSVLSWLGPGFAAGSTAMVVLSFGSIVVLAAGNVQSLLLMSGRSGWSAINKVIVLVVNVVGNLVLVPRFGIEAAATVWAFCMALDTILAAYQVRRATGIALEFRSILYLGIVVSACVAGPALVVRSLMGHSTSALLVSIVIGGILLLVYATVDRRRLDLDQLVPTLTKRSTGAEK